MLAPFLVGTDSLVVLTALCVAIFLAASVAAIRARADARVHLQAIITGQERERQRWARELHDDTLQDLAALRLMVATAEYSPDPARHRRALQSAAMHLDEQISNLRHLIAELRPPLLDEVGLRSALEALRARMEAVHDLTIDLAFFAMPGADTLERPVIEAVYRIVQEALSNAVKHSRARRLQVSVTGLIDAVMVEVEDDGVGFDQSRMTSDGYGLVSMRERAGALGGRLDILSTPGRGTRISVKMPLAQLGTAGSTGPRHALAGVVHRVRRATSARHRSATVSELINPWETDPAPAGSHDSQAPRRRRGGVVPPIPLTGPVAVAGPPRSSGSRHRQEIDASARLGRHAS